MQLKALVKKAVDIVESNSDEPESLSWLLEEHPSTLQKELAKSGLHMIKYSASYYHED